MVRRSGMGRGSSNESVYLNDYLHRILNGTAEAILILKPNGDIRIFNEYARILTQQFTNKDISLIPNIIEAVPSFRKEPLKKVLQEVSKGNHHSSEVLYPGPKWLETNFSLVVYPGQEETEICCTIRDISNRKLMNERFLKNEAYYQTLFESMMEGVIFQSSEPFKSSANSSAVKLLEIPAENLRAYGLLSPRLHWVDRNGKPTEIRKLFGNSLTIREAVTEKVIGLKTNNTVKWLLINAAPVKNDEFREMTGIFTFIDFTRIIQYREEHALLTQVMKEISNIVVITDKDQKITWVNDSFTRASGYTQEEVRGQKPSVLLDGPEKDPLEKKKISAAIKMGVPVQGEILNYTKTGSAYWCDYNIHPVRDENGEVSKFFSIQRDVTEFKAVQEQIQKQKIEYHQKIAAAKLRAQEEKQTQIGQELHDNINQILAVSQLYTGMIEKGKGDVQKNAALVSQYLRMAISEIRNLSHQLVSPRFDERPFSEICESVFQNVKPGTRVTHKIKLGNERLVTTEIKLAFYRIIQEQSNNINKYAKAKNITLELKEEKGTIILTLQDDGIGFDPLQTKKGIGLNNIRSRAESLNGKAEIVSKPGEGCKLVVTIPVEGA